MMSHDIQKRRGGRGWGCAVSLVCCSHVACVGCLIWCINHMAKPHGMTFVPFYSAKMEIMSEKGTKVA